MFLLLWVPFTAVGTANNFLFIVFIMLMGVAYVSHRLGKRNVRAVNVERRFPDEIFAGSPFVVTYLVNTKFRPWGASAVVFGEQPVLDGGKSIVFPQVLPDETTPVHNLANVSARGYQSVGSGTISSSFPFGLATYSRNSGVLARILVFPRIEPVDVDIPSWVGSAGKNLEKVGPFGTVPFHLREYVAGDPYKHIEWKKSAQVGILMSKVLSDEQAREIIIRVPENASERAITRAASLVVHFSRARTPLTLAGPGFVIGPDRGPEFGRKLLTILACWENRGLYGEALARCGGIVVNVDASGEFHWQYQDTFHGEIPGSAGTS